MANGDDLRDQPFVTDDFGNCLYRRFLTEDVPKLVWVTRRDEWLLRHCVGIDDFGNCLYRCYYTGVLLKHDEGVVHGALTGNCNYVYVADTSELAKRLHKENKIAFDESEENCNTCKHLVRVPHKKCKFGFLYGKCGRDGRDLTFHPNDPLHMKCYESRYR